MSFWESKAIKKTRKEHRCEYCGAKIPAGSSCRNEVGTYEGDFNHYYLCHRCVLFMNRFVDKSDRDWLGEFLDALTGTDLLDCPKCKHWNNRDREFTEDMQAVKLECDECGHVWTVDLSLEALKAYDKAVKPDA